MYLYTPEFHDEETDHRSPGSDPGGGMEDMVGCVGSTCKVLHHDPGVRFVLDVNWGTVDMQPDWEMKTAEEVNTDYPGLI